MYTPRLLYPCPFICQRTFRSVDVLSRFEGHRKCVWSLWLNPAPLAAQEGRASLGRSGVTVGIAPPGGRFLPEVRRRHEALGAWHGLSIPRANRREAWGWRGRGGGLKRLSLPRCHGELLPWASGEGGRGAQGQGANIASWEALHSLGRSSPGRGPWRLGRYLGCALPPRARWSPLSEPLESPSGVLGKVGFFTAEAVFTAEAWGWATTHSVAKTSSPKLTQSSCSKSESKRAALIGLPTLMPAVCDTQGPCQAQTKSPDALLTAAL